MHVDVPAPVAPPSPPEQAPGKPSANGAGKPAENPAPRTTAWPWRTAAILALVAVACIAIALTAVRALRPAAPARDLALSGRLEGYQSDLGAKVGGRVAWVAVREGAAVRAGQVLVRLDDADARAQTAAAAAAFEAAEDRARQSEASVAVLASQIHETALGGEQASADTRGRVAQARASLASARAQVVEVRASIGRAQAALDLARADRSRYTALQRTGDISTQRAQEADAAYGSAAADLRAQRAALAAAEQTGRAAGAALAIAQSTSFNVPIRGAQIVTLERQQRQAQAQIAADRAEARQARALHRGAEAAQNDLTVLAPRDGTVIARAVEPGVVVAPGRILLSIVDLDRVYLRGYITEGDIGRVRVGQAAHVVLDSDPDHPLEARVSEIDAQASFTPENIYFKADRVQQVFGVKLDLRAPRGFAKPGMPADATIDIAPS